MRLDEAVRTIERVLIESRVEAMQQGRPIAVAVELRGDSIRVDGVGMRRSCPSRACERSTRREQVRVQFGPDGRADGLVLRFAGPGLDVQRAFDLGLLKPLPGVDGEAGSGLAVDSGWFGSTLFREHHRLMYAVRGTDWMRRRETVQRGFSLLEMLVVLAIIGLLVALFAPRLTARSRAVR